MSDDLESFCEEGIDKEIGKSGTERLEYDREECNDEDILNIESLEFIRERSEHEGPECDFFDHPIACDSGTLDCCSYVCSKVHGKWSVFPRNDTQAQNREKYSSKNDGPERGESILSREPAKSACKDFCHRTEAF